MADRIVTAEDDFSHSKRIPLAVLEKKLERDTRLIEKALQILSVEDPESAHTEAGAVSELLNHWLVNRELDYYINGQRGDDFTTLTVIPVNGDYGKGLAAMEAWITIDKQELVELLRSRGFIVPDNLLNPKAQNVNWNYWAALDLWPLDAACKLVCGVDPEESTPEEDAANIANRSSRARLPWVNVYHQAVSAVKAGKLGDVNGEVTPAIFIAWAQGKGRDMSLELLAMADEQVAIKADKARSNDQARAAEEPAATAASHDPAAAAANPFAAMDGLTWAEITITFYEEEAVRVKAHGKSETYTYDAMGLRDRKSHMAKPNKCWETFMLLAIVSSSDKAWGDVFRNPDLQNLKKRISLLRGELKRFFGIDRGDPIAYKRLAGYQAAFKLTIEKHVVEKVRERRLDHADEDEDEDIEQVMSEPAR